MQLRRQEQRRDDTPKPAYDARKLLSNWVDTHTHTDRQTHRQTDTNSYFVCMHECWKKVHLHAHWDRNTNSVHVAALDSQQTHDRTLTCTWQQAPKVEDNRNTLSRHSTMDQQPDTTDRRQGYLVEDMVVEFWRVIHNCDTTRLKRVSFLHTFLHNALL